MANTYRSILAGFSGLAASITPLMPAQAIEAAPAAQVVSQNREYVVVDKAFKSPKGTWITLADPGDNAKQLPGIPSYEGVFFSPAKSNAFYQIKTGSSMSSDGAEEMNFATSSDNSEQSPQIS